MPSPRALALGFPGREPSPADASQLDALGAGIQLACVEASSDIFLGLLEASVFFLHNLKRLPHLAWAEGLHLLFILGIFVFQEVENQFLALVLGSRGHSFSAFGLNSVAPPPCPPP